MKTVIEKLSEVFMEAFEKSGYDAELGRVVISNRPDLCQYQCNGSMSAAKVYHKAPIMIANDVIANVPNNNIIENISVVNPGFINIIVKDKFLTDYMYEMMTSENCGSSKTENPKNML